MRKKTIAWLFIVGIILAIVGAVLYLPGITSMAQAAQTGATPQVGAGFAIGLIVLIVGGILSFIAWIGTLVATGKQGRWGWFVAVLILGLISLSWLIEIIYLIAGPGLPAKDSAPVAA